MPEILQVVEHFHQWVMFVKSLCLQRMEFAALGCQDVFTLTVNHFVFLHLLVILPIAHDSPTHVMLYNYK